MDARSLPPRLLAALLLALALTPAARGADELPPPETVRAQLKTVAIMPSNVPMDFPRYAEVEHRIEQALEARFAAAGIAVVPASVMAELQQKVRTALGGFYDPHTGQADQARLDMFDEHVRSEFRRLHPIDAWVFSRVDVRRAYAERAWMSWDGVQESSIGSDDTTRDMFKVPQGSGGLPALSLVLVVTRPDGQPLYGRYGGLQPLQYFGTGSVAKNLFQMPQQLHYVSVDRDKVLTDPAREQRALALTLDPLLKTQAERDATKDADKAAWKQIAPCPILAPAAAATPPDRAAVLARYPRVAVAAADVLDMPQRAAVRERYTQSVVNALQQAGFTVVPPAEYAAIWEPIYAAAGGFYDPLTGEYLKAKREAALREAFAKLGSTTPIDAVFLPAVVPRVADIDEGQAKWDGLAVPLGKGGMFDKSKQFGGTMKALSLELTAVDANLAEIYHGYGGIELRERFKGGGLMSTGTFKDVPAVDWLSDASRDAPATLRALGALAGPPTP